MKPILLCVLTATIALSTTSTTTAAPRKPHHKPQHHFKQPRYHDRIPTPHRYARISSDGVLIDRAGWRYNNNNWDNTCFRTLDYLHSISSCTGGAP